MKQQLQALPISSGSYRIVQVQGQGCQVIVQVVQLPKCGAKMSHWHIMKQTA